MEEAADCLVEGWSEAAERLVAPMGRATAAMLAEARAVGWEDDGATARATVAVPATAVLRAGRAVVWEAAVHWQCS